jgi:hypothetical protein
VGIVAWKHLDIVGHMPQTWAIRTVQSPGSRDTFVRGIAWAIIILFLTAIFLPLGCLMMPQDWPLVAQVPCGLLTIWGLVGVVGAVAWAAMVVSGEWDEMKGS